MTAYEEQYSSGVTNDMMQFMSTVSLLTVNYQQGESASVTFDLQSNYIPLFTSPTMGELSLTSSTPGTEGYLSVSNSTATLHSGGCLSLLTNNRYFVDESLYFELSTLLYEQRNSSPLINTTLQFSLIRVEPSTNGSINLSMSLINITGGPITLSSGSPFALSVTALSKDYTQLNGNLTLTYYSSLGFQIYNSLSESLTNLKGISIGYVNEGNGYGIVDISSSSTPIILNVTEMTILVSDSISS